MKNLIAALTLLGFIFTLSNGFIVKPAQEQHKEHGRFTINKDHQQPQSAFVPNGLKIDESVFDNLMKDLSSEVSKHHHNHDIKAKGYFPKDNEEDDEWDQLAFLEEHDAANDEDDDHMQKIFADIPSNSDVDVDFGKREFTFTRILTVFKNGTKAFSKLRQSTQATGSANANVKGNKTTLATKTSATANFAVNVTISTHHGKDETVAVSGGSTVTGTSQSRLEKRRLLSGSRTESVTNVKIPSLENDVTVNTTVLSVSETFNLPLRSFFTIFSSDLDVNIRYGESYDAGTQGNLAGEVTSHVAFATKNSSLTKSYVKAFLKTSSNTGFAASVVNSSEEESNEADDNDDNQDDNNKNEGGPAGQVVLIKAKVHTWTKFVSKSQSGYVIDIITCTKTRAYGKSWQKGSATAFSGTGQISWEKSQLTVSSDEYKKISTNGLGLQFVHKQIEHNSIVGSASFGALTG